MKSIYLDASAGISGDMLLAALLDLGADRKRFAAQMTTLGLPVEIRIHETKRSSLRALKVDVRVNRKDHLHRKWEDIEALIQTSAFSSPVKQQVRRVFKTLFTAEAKVHGHSLEKTHLHEAGADDALIDIFGTCFLLEELKITEILCSPLNLGSGRVKASHGSLPVPPPAVAEILKNIPVYSAWVEEELVTPTGAALIACLADKFRDFPEISYQLIGYGAGGRDTQGFPNILRVFAWEKRADLSGKQIYQIEANIDDSSPQILAHFFDLAFKMGALDAYLSPVVMKKNRLGTQLTLLTDTARRDQLIEAVFKETTTIGIRFFPVERRVLPREMCEVKVMGENIRLKIARLDSQKSNVQPEYSDCRKAAQKTGIALKKIIAMAVHEYWRRQNSGPSSSDTDKTV